MAKIYILTSTNTASASELVINGLKPHIGVVQIGDVTKGKNVGSVTLYDSPTFGKEKRNPNHRYAHATYCLENRQLGRFRRLSKWVEIPTLH